MVGMVGHSPGLAAPRRRVGVCCALAGSQGPLTSRGPGDLACLDLCVLPADHPGPRGFPTLRSIPAL